jgi:light-regulated signal transduction histidine kinase (bacteriophytochrome)
VGIPANKITGTYFNSYIDSVGDFQLLKSRLHTGVSNGEIVLNIGGKKLYVHMSLTDLRPAVPAIGIIVTDLAAKRKQKEELELCQYNLELKVRELESINTSLKGFFHVVSHDLKEPLRKIIAASNPRAKEAGQIAGFDQLSSISASAGRLNSLVENLVKNAEEVSRDALVKIDLNQTMAEVMEDLSLMISESGVHIHCYPLPTITGSEVQVRQLFLNVIAYSIRSCRDQSYPQINIEAEITDCVDIYSPNKKFHRITVRDNCPVADTTELEQAKALFEQPQGNELPFGDMGMIICKRVIDQYEGRISLEYVQGEGCRLMVCFPLEESQANQ